MESKTPFYRQAAATSLVGALLCLIVLTALHALLGPLHGLDVALQMKTHALHGPLLDRVMLAFTLIGAIKIFSISLAAVLIGLLWRGHKRAAPVLAYAILGALILNESFKLLFHRARPVLPWSIGDEHTFSYPSGHSLFSVTLYGTLCWLSLRHGTPIWRVLPVAIVMPLVIGLSRVYLGEHYPTDIVAGWVCGGIWLATVIRVARRWPHPASSR